MKFVIVAGVSALALCGCGRNEFDGVDLPIANNASTYPSGGPPHAILTINLHDQLLLETIRVDTNSIEARVESPSENEMLSALSQARLPDIKSRVHTYLDRRAQLAQLNRAISILKSAGTRNLWFVVYIENSGITSAPTIPHALGITLSPESAEPTRAEPVP